MESMTAPVLMSHLGNRGQQCINPKERGGRELPPKLVQTLLGHSSIVMTLDVYGYLFRDDGDRTELAEASRLLLA